MLLKIPYVLNKNQDKKDMSLAISEVMYCEPFSLFVIVNTINIVTIFTTMTKKYL